MQIQSKKCKGKDQNVFDRNFCLLIAFVLHLLCIFVAFLVPLLCMVFAFFGAFFCVCLVDKCICFAIFCVFFAFQGILYLFLRFLCIFSGLVLHYFCIVSAFFPESIAKGSSGKSLEH